VIFSLLLVVVMTLTLQIEFDLRSRRNRDRWWRLFSIDRDHEQQADDYLSNFHFYSIVDRVMTNNFILIQLKIVR
jgi:hypothetical protein